MSRDKMEPNEPAALVTTRNGVWDDPTERAIASAVQKRDAEWRAAVERVRESHPGVLAPAEYSVPEARVWARGAESALKSLLAAMEAK